VSRGAPRRFHRLRKVILVALAVVLTLGIVGFAANSAISASEAHRYRARGSFVRIGGRKLHFRCSGSGSPTVVFESGFGGSSLDWTLVQPAVAKHARACSYDRAGYGYSDAAPTHSLARIRADFDAFLHAAQIDGPIVLVAHSFGGLIALDYASQHSARVAGLVFVDAATKATYERMNDRIPAFYSNGKKLAFVTKAASVLTRFGLTRLANQPASPKTVAPGIRGEYRALGFQPRLYRAFSDDSAAIASYVGDALDAPRTDIPAYVLTHKDPLTMWTGVPKAEAESIWQDEQQALAARFHAKHLIVDGTGHFIEVLRPDAVISAIDDVLSKIAAQ